MFKNENELRQRAAEDGHNAFLKTIGLITKESLKKADAVGHAWYFGSLVLLWYENPDYVQLVVEQWLNNPLNKDFEVKQIGPMALLFLYGLMRDKKDWHNSFLNALKEIKENSVEWQYLYVKAGLTNKVNIWPLIGAARDDVVQRMWHLDRHYSDTMFYWLEENKEILWSINNIANFFEIFHLVDEEKRLLLLDIFSDKVTALTKDVVHCRYLLKILSSSLEKRRCILQILVENNWFRFLKTENGIDVKSLLEIVSDYPKERQKVFKDWIREERLHLNSDGDKMGIQVNQMLDLLRFLSAAPSERLEIFKDLLKIKNSVCFFGLSGVFKSTQEFINFLRQMFEDEESYERNFFEGANYLKDTRFCLKSSEGGNQIEQWINEGVLSFSGEHGFVQSVDDLVFYLNFLSDLEKKRLEIFEGWIKEGKIQLSDEGSPLRTAEDLVCLLNCLANDPGGKRVILQDWIERSIYSLNCRDWNDFRTLLEGLQDKESSLMEQVLHGQDMNNAVFGSNFQVLCKKLLEDFFQNSSSRTLFRCG